MTKNDLQGLSRYYSLVDFALCLLQSSVISIAEYQMVEQKAAGDAHLSETSIYREKWRELLDLSRV